MQAAKKYYDFAAVYEMNDLHRNGIDGVRVIMYGTSADEGIRSSDQLFAVVI